jgi:hypothetical protein
MIVAGRPSVVPARLQRVIDCLVVGALVGGTPYDRSVALDCLPLASPTRAWWAVGRTMHQETVPTLQSKALDKAVALRLLPVDDDDIERPMLLAQAFRTERSWSTRDDGSEDSLGGQLAILTAMTAISAAVLARTAIVQWISLPNRRPGDTGALWAGSAAALVWHVGCRGLGPRTLTVAAAWVVCAIGVIGLLYGALTIGPALIWPIFGYRHNLTYYGVQAIIALAAAWPLIAILAVAGGASRTSPCTGTSQNWHDTG